MTSTQPRPAGPEHRPRRGAAGAAVSGIRRGAAAAARAQVSAASRFRGGYHDYIIKRGGIEVFPRLVAGEHRLEPQPGQASQRHRRDGCTARRRHRAWHQHADRRGGGNRQVVAGGAVRGGRSCPRPDVGAVHLRRKHPHAADPVRRARDRPAVTRRRGARHRAAGGPRRAFAGRVCPRHPPGRRRTRAYPSWSSTA